MKGQISLTNSGGSSPTDQDLTARAAPPRKRFHLSGHSATLDPTVHAVRGDLADVELADRVFAPHYAKAMPRSLAVKTVLHAKPSAESDVVAHLETGASVDLFDVSGGWAWVRSASGMGYVPADTLAPA
jgi:hypothetical protein